MKHDESHVVPFAELGKDDVARVGGKNASLGEMTRRLGEAGIRVPDGFATTARAYREFLEHNELADRIEERLAEYHHDRASLEETGAAIRALFEDAEWPDDRSTAIREAYRRLAEEAGT